MQTGQADRLSRRSHPIRMLSAASMLAIALAGCGGSEDEPDPAPTPTPPPVTAEAPWTPADPAVAIAEIRELSEWYRAVLTNASAITNPRQLEGLARPLCEGLSVCQVGIWYGAEIAPTALPATAVQLREQAFAFSRTAAGVERTLWNCTLFPQFEAERHCLPRLMQQ